MSDQDSMIRTTAGSDAGGGRRVSLIGVLKWVGFPGVVTIGIFLWGFWPAQVRARLTTCHPYYLVLETQNRGGQTATLGPPRIGIISDQRRIEYNLRILTGHDPTARGVVGWGPAETQPLKAYDPYFTRDESRGRCRILVAVPFTPSGGNDRLAWGSCRCEFVS